MLQIIYFHLLRTICLPNQPCSIESIFPVPYEKFKQLNIFEEVGIRIVPEIRVRYEVPYELFEVQTATWYVKYWLDIARRCLVWEVRIWCTNNNH
ncbi:hypothetical protein CEXT_739931 [Caerostris extrusa]|uniref:Uncharacterized protein n=1 Tax=Caerostris extrusa TaxID=172846 RepID=A0AAV4WYD5_CAEEX|nr:hypothetical protein CEXT_739931 [Caerostris extrusa]